MNRLDLADDGDSEPLELKDTRTAIPPSCCEDPCPLAASCGSRLWACRAFALYVEHGRWPRDAERKPTPQIYARIFPGEGNRAPAPEIAPPEKRRHVRARKVRLSFGRPPLAEQVAARKAERLAERAS